MAGVKDRFPSFWRVVMESPSLRARAREGLEEVETALTEALTEASVADPHLRAALTVAAYRPVYATTARRLLDGEPAAELIADHRARIEAGFDALERMHS